MKMNFKSIQLSTLFIVIISFASACNAQGKSKQAISKHANENSSLQISTHIFDILEDSKGNLWFGTYKDGVAKYDGKSLTY